MHFAGSADKLFGSKLLVIGAKIASVAIKVAFRRLFEISFAIRAIYLNLGKIVNITNPIVTKLIAMHQARLLNKLSCIRLFRQNYFYVLTWQR